MTTPHPRLPETTTQWIAALPQRGNPVAAVWARLAELDRAGQETSAVIAALRTLLLRHQPTRHGHCPACPRRGLRRRRFPCVVWHRAHLELFSPRVVADQAISRTLADAPGRFARHHE
ncbi:MAG TPA: hypothetical protein VHY21_13100 [Pseudonocardiaceae bacterium]|jgi:hypothetical protein|nr:hypothetical protein [Pseudonocardiaceae bacterium]